MKICNICNEKKSLNEFYKNKRMKDGYFNICKKCKKEQRKNYYKNNIKYYKEYQKNNSEKIKEYQKEYQNNYYKNNIKKIKEYKKQ